MPNSGYALTEEFPTSQTDRYHKDTVIVYQRKINKSRIYNKNSVHFIKQNNNNDNDNNNNQDYLDLLDDYNNVYSTENNVTYNPKNIIKRGNTPKMATNDKPRTLRHNYSSKTLYKVNEIKVNITNEKAPNKDNEIFTNNTRNYRIVNVKHTSHKNLDTFNMTTPNNTKIHTIVCSSKKANNDNNNKTIPLPQKLFSNTERKVITVGKYVPERNIQREIEEYFFKNRIRYANRQKYINAALLIQTTFREFKKNGKIKFNFIKKYVKFYRAVNLVQNLFKNKNKYWKSFKDKMIAYAKYINKLSKRKISRPINKLKDNDTTKIGQISKMFDQNNQNPPNETKVLRHQSKDLTNVNVEKIIKENEDLQKLLNSVMKENSLLKSMNLNNKDLLNKNLALKEKLDKTERKTKQLQIENEQYLSEYSKAKNKYTKIEGEVADVNKKLKITYLKFIIEKKELKMKQILNKYFKRYKEICQKLVRLEKKNSDTITDSNNSLINLLSTAVKTNTDKYVTKKSEEEKKIKEEEEKKKKKQEELMRKRNKLLMELFYNKDKERTRFIHSCFSKFYYKGMINQYKFRRSAMLDKLRESKIPLNKLEEEKKRKEEEERKKREEEEKRIKDEEEKKKKEEEEKIKKEEEEKKIKEEEERKKKEEEEKKAEDDSKSEEQRRINKLNMDRRRKLKKLFQEEKNKNLEIKRRYFKKFHFKAFFFASHYFKTETKSKLSDENNDEEDNNENQEKSLAQKMKEEQELKEKQEREELIKIRNKKLQSIIFKKDRKYIIIKKNILQRWNLTAKLISLGPKKKLRGRSKRRGDSKRGDSKKKAVTKKPENEQKNLKIKKDDNDDNSEDEKDKNKDDEKKSEETNKNE